MDRDGVRELLGQEVAVRLVNREARGVEIQATLDAAREDGITLSRIGLGPGPTMFCPWDAVRSVRAQPPSETTYMETVCYTSQDPTIPAGLTPLDREPVEVPERPQPSARSLVRVVPVARKEEAGGITVALASLEVYEKGLGVLRYRLSYDEDLFWEEHGYEGFPEPELIIRDASGDFLPWAPRGGSGSDGEYDGEAEVKDLPDTGELEVEVVRIGFRDWTESEEAKAYEGPWKFRVSV